VLNHHTPPHTHAPHTRVPIILTPLTTELINYFIELCSGEVKSSIFLDKKQLRERAKLLKKLSVFTKELERAEEEMSHMKAERDRYNFSNSLCSTLHADDTHTNMTRHNQRHDTTRHTRTRTHDTRHTTHDTRHTHTHTRHTHGTHRTLLHRTRTRSVVDVPLPQESVLKDPVVVVEGLVRRTKQVGG
jgi:hypothetical protein